MKKKVLMLVLVVVLCVASLAGCASNRVYSRNVADMDALAVAAGSDFKLPTITLDGENKFYDPEEYKDVVTIPAGAKNNEIVLLYVPNITKDDETALVGKKDDKFYRYSIKMTLDETCGELYSKGKVEIYLHGSNFNRVDQENYASVKKVSLDERKAKMDKDNKGDMNKITNNESYTDVDKALYWMSAVEGDVYKYSNRQDSQVMRYYVNETANTAYEVTACIYMNNDAFKDIKDATEKNTAIETAYKTLLADATVRIDALLAQVKG